MEDIYKERLTKIANHLLHGELGHKIFDFRYFNIPEGDVFPENPNTCLHSGDVIGEFPIIFPEDWYWNNNWVYLRGHERTCLRNIKVMFNVCSYLSISEAECEMLFFPTPEYCEPPLWNPIRFDYNTTKEMVAESILKFIKFREAGYDLG